MLLSGRLQSLRTVKVFLCVPGTSFLLEENPYLRIVSACLWTQGPEEIWVQLVLVEPKDLTGGKEKRDNGAPKVPLPSVEPSV